MSHQKVKNVMSTDVATVREDTPFKDVARLLAQRDVSALPVIDTDRHVLGVVSEGDLLIKQGTQEIQWDHSLRTWWHDHRHHRRNHRRTTATTAGQLMTHPAVTTTPTTTVAAAARTMAEHHIKRLPVTDDHATLIGIVSRKDVLAVFLRTDEDIRADIIHWVFHMGIGMAVTPATVTIDVHHGEVTITGQLDLKSQLTLVKDMTTHIDGVINVTITATYRHDDTHGHLNDLITTNMTQPPPRAW